MESSRRSFFKTNFQKKFIFSMKRESLKNTISIKLDNFKNQSKVKIKDERRRIYENSKTQAIGFCGVVHSHKTIITELSHCLSSK